MLKAVFIGSHNEFNEVIVHWLSRQTELVGVVWTHSTAWQQTWQGRMLFARKRWRRFGFWKMVDETLFYLYYHKCLHRQSARRLEECVIEPYWREHGDRRWNGDAIFTSNVNSPEVHEFVQTRKPDVALAMCINNYFKRDLRERFRHGVLLWHEGITPEYKGLYSPFWAVYNLEFDRLGYTLLRMNDKYDAGEILVQGQAENIDPHRDTHCYIGHKAIADSLPEVARLLRDLEAGTVRPVERTAAISQSYTYPGMSDFIRQRARLRRQRQATHIEQGARSRFFETVRRRANDHSTTASSVCATKRGCFGMEVPGRPE